MFYSVRHGGWVFPGDNGHPPRELRDRWLPPATWPFCPFCGGALPSLESAAEQIVRDEGDDGN